jgi:hypothetical protein
VVAESGAPVVAEACHLDGHLTFTEAEWRAFTEGVAAGEF